MPASFTFTADGEEHGVSVVSREPELCLSVDGTTYTVSEAGALDGDTVLLNVDGRTYQVWRTHEGDRVHLRIGNRTFSVGYEDPIRAAQHHAGGDDTLRADMPGVVVEVHVEPGASVVAGDALVTIESMKMQIPVVAPRDGAIDVVHVGINEAFDKGAALVSLRALD